MGRGGTSGAAVGPVSGVLADACLATWAGLEDVADGGAVLTFLVAGLLLRTACGARVRSRSRTGDLPPVRRLHFFVRGPGDTGCVSRPAPSGPRTNPRARSERTVPPLRVGVGSRGRQASTPARTGAPGTSAGSPGAGACRSSRGTSRFSRGRRFSGSALGFCFEAGSPSGQSGRVLDFALR